MGGLLRTAPLVSGLLLPRRLEDVNYLQGPPVSPNSVEHAQLPPIPQLHTHNSPGSARVTDWPSGALGPGLGLAPK